MGKSHRMAEPEAEEQAPLPDPAAGQADRKRKDPGTPEAGAEGPAKAGRREKRGLDWTKHNERHVAIRIAYLGAKYDGFASQETTEQTIEGHLFAALTKTCLVRDRATAAYSRCGRTDKGVSAFGQVISLNVRCKARTGVGVIAKATAAGASDDVEEINYVQVLNRVLPEDIRAVAWAPVPVDFDARFSCLYRTYKYYFVRGRLDIERMHTAAQAFVGEHDFRNFCKMDIANEISNFTRRILHFSAALSEGSDPDDPLALCEFTITGFAFLWHQVRCMTAVLFMIGRGEEDPSIIPRLLDIAAHPRKPQYGLASDLPLVLFDCGFEDVQWRHDTETLGRLMDDFSTMWERFAISAAMVKGMMQAVGGFLLPRDGQPVALRSLPRAVAASTHKPLLGRAVGEIPEVRLKKKREKAEASG
eukprot:m.9492 g.9492  ORF g.9492 m.9492 type:complete len:418 (-) comp2417_c0_seq1:35-1288(-)